jgi:hypothetical protein
MNKYAAHSKAPRDPGDRYSVVHGCKNKRRYTNEKLAERVAARATRQRGLALRTYPCPLCQGWHITKRRTFT